MNHGDFALQLPLPVRLSSEFHNSAQQIHSMLRPRWQLRFTKREDNSTFDGKFPEERLSHPDDAELYSTMEPSCWRDLRGGRVAAL